MSPGVRLAAWPLLVAVSLVAGCGAPDDGEAGRPLLPDVDAGEPEASGGPLTGLPATFTGVLPCEDCPGVDYHLNLFADGSFFLRTVRRDQPMGTTDDIGRWDLSSDGDTLLLTGSQGPRYLALQDRVTLRWLDASGRPKPSTEPADLVRAPAFKALYVHATLRGTYVSMMDTGMFTECLTQRRWLVANEGGAAALEAVYREQQSQAGEPLLVSVTGQLARRSSEDGESRDVLLVESVVNASAGAPCPTVREAASLQGTTWRLTRVRGRDVESVPPRGTPPTLTLGASSAEFVGSTRCNRTLGTFRRDGAAITFDAAVTTRRECPPDLAADEAFLTMLEDVVEWRIFGRVLELTDARGAVLARFEAA